MSTRMQLRRCSRVVRTSRRCPCARGVMRAVCGRAAAAAAAAVLASAPGAPPSDQNVQRVSVLLSGSAPIAPAAAAIVPIPAAVADGLSSCAVITFDSC